jgi:hypothetical protein
MHGYTNFQQSKALWEHGYRHPNNMLDVSEWNEYYQSNLLIELNVQYYPSFSLADLVTMQGAIYHVPAIAPMKDIIQSYVDSALHEGDTLVQQSNERLNQAYAN